MDDRQLIKEFIENGSEKAFARITERHMRMVYGTCLREIQDTTLAEDATQIVFLVFARRARSLRNAKALASWLFITSRNVSRKLLRRERRRMGYEQEAFQQSMAHDQTDRTWGPISEELNDAVAALKQSDREIILRRFYEGMTFKEAGEELQISENTASVRSTRAVERLRRHLVRAGIAVTTAALVSLLGSEAARATARTSPRLLSSDPRLQHIATGAIRQMFLTKLSIASIFAVAAMTGAVGAYKTHSHSTALPSAPRPAVATTNQSLVKLTSDPVNDPNLSGSKILQQCRNAYDSVKTFQQDAQSSVGGFVGSAHIVYQGPGNLRVTGTTLGVAGGFSEKYDLVCNSSGAWQYVAGTWSKVGSAELGIGGITGISGSAGSGVPALLLHGNGGWGDVLAGLDKIDSVASETIGGRSVYRVSGTLNGRVSGKDFTESTTLWIDPKTFFLVKSEVMNSATPGAAAITVTYSPPTVDQPIPASVFVR